VAVTSAFVFDLNGKVLISDKPKTKRDNAFHYVVPRLASVSSLRVASGWQMRVQNYEFYAKRENIFGIICKYRE